MGLVNVPLLGALLHTLESVRTRLAKCVALEEPNVTTSDQPVASVRRPERPVLGLLRICHRRFLLLCMFARVRCCRRIGSSHSSYVSMDDMRTFSFGHHRGHLVAFAIYV